MATENTPLEKVSNMIKNSVMLKLLTITVLMLLLLIPASMIQSIIEERELLSNQTIHEVSSKWAEQQLINGPILTIPLVYEYEKNDEIKTFTNYWNILPEALQITGDIEPQKLRRGIYEVVVYQSKLAISGNYKLPAAPEEANLVRVQYDHAFLTIGISDLRGIKSQIGVNWGKETLDVSPGSKLDNLIYSGVTVDLPELTESKTSPLDFNFELDLQGSQNISFIPLGSTTNVDLQSPWDSPSFNGNFLPDSREVTEAGFNASWSVLQLNRNYPQSWIGAGDQQKMLDSSFGVDLLLPLDDYQKSMRSAKYAVMTIALTFLIFFLVEILNKRKIHPFQYALVGLALCLFYVLLVSISEHSNFNLAYGISMLAIVSMITMYASAVFKARKLTVLLLSTLVGLYGFLFVTLQLADYALLMGSIGLTLILGATMYFTRKINWYQLNREN